MIDYKRHPKRQHVSVKSDGKAIKYYGEIIYPKEHEPKKGKKLMVVYLKGTYYSLAKLVAETYLEPPKSDKRHYAICKDGDFRNTHPDNLEWTVTNAPKDIGKRVDNALKRSKLTIEQSVDCHQRHTKEGVSLKELAQEYNVSDMSIHRAIKRIKSVETKWK